MSNIKNKARILLVGNFLSADISGSRGICEEIGLHLVNRDWPILTTSRHSQRLHRFFDMLLTILLKKNIYDVASVDVYSGLAFFWAEGSANLLGMLQKPYVLVLHGGGLAEFSIKNPHRLKKLLLPAQRVVTPSLFIKRKLYELRSDIQYLPNALDLSGYDYVQRHQVRRKMVWLRALHEIYQPEMAVHVLALLKQEFPDIELLMVGPDKKDGSRDKMEQAAASLGVTDVLNWIGPVPKSEVPKILNQGDIFLNTTRYESFGVSVMEAAACGLPIVTTDAGELPFLWRDETDALVVPVDDASAMANAVRRILRSPELAEKLSRNARTKAEGCDWSVILPQWESLFQELSGMESL